MDSFGAVCDGCPRASKKSISDELNVHYLIRSTPGRSLAGNEPHGCFSLIQYDYHKMHSLDAADAGRFVQSDKINRTSAVFITSFLLML